MGGGLHIRGVGEVRPQGATDETTVTSVGGGLHIRGVGEVRPQGATDETTVTSVGGRTSQPRGCGVRPPHEIPTPSDPPVRPTTTAPSFVAS